MSRISKEQLSQAQREVEDMDFDHKSRLADELYQKQPNMFAEILRLKRMNISRERVEFVLHIILVCYFAVKKSGNFLPLIGQDEIDRQTMRFLEIVKIENWFNDLSIEKILNQTLGSNSEEILSGFVYIELTLFHYNVLSAENDKYVILVASTLVNCIEGSLSEHNNQIQPTQKPRG